MKDLYSWIGDQSTTYKKLQEGNALLAWVKRPGHWIEKAPAINIGTPTLMPTMLVRTLVLLHPFYIGVHHQHVYAFSWTTHTRHFSNFGASNNRFSSFSADAGEMNYYFIHGKTVAKIIQHYTWLTAGWNYRHAGASPTSNAV